ncbi:hypothetical protein SCP_0204570 [Sparassis crispa]|uniref:Uncharacterized protein n=1 Tax=Sparassis crispa TaxID=139825 RepID=A0A401GAS6_9APHY|nr:hypothetical protein SCP_0204570 [Sparassis crispa]GBE79259.1 hypothetical protein SCP_0204570 [Sparassis crispa]
MEWRYLKDQWKMHFQRPGGAESVSLHLFSTIAPIASTTSTASVIIGPSDSGPHIHFTKKSKDFITSHKKRSAMKNATASVCTRETAREKGLKKVGEDKKEKGKAKEKDREQDPDDSM